MVGIGAEGDDLGAERGEGLAEGRRIANPGERGDPAAGEPVGRVPYPHLVTDGNGRMARLGPHPGERSATGLGQTVADLRPPLGRDAPGPRQDRGVGPGEPGEPLTEQPPGEDVATSERIGGIDGHEIEIAGQTAVLEAVVEHDDVGAGHSRRRGGHDPIAAGNVQDSGEQQRQFGRFVALLPGRGRVSPADDRRLAVEGHQTADDPGHQGGLASAPEREVTDTYDREAGRRRGEPAAVVGGVAQGHHRRPGGAERRQGDSRECRRGAGVGPIDELLERFCVRMRHAVDPSVGPGPAGLP